MTRLIPYAGAERAEARAGRKRGPSKPKGFAAMDPELQRSIASKGGKSVAPENRMFARDPAHAAACGRIGGHNVPAERRGFARNPEAAKAAGEKGARVLAALRRARRDAPHG